MSIRFRRLLNSFIAFLLLTISPGAFAQATQNLVGFWWKPTESGWGLTIQQQGTSTFAVWFTYDTQGAAIWYTLTCTFSGSTCAGDLYTGSGTPMLQITGSANLVATKVGTGTITTTGTNRLSLGYTIGSVTQTKTNLEPQNFAVADQIPFCSLQSLSGATPRAGLTNFTDHWWGGSNASGWGLQISHQGNTVFAGWYSYNAQGTATWLTAIGTQDAANARRFTGNIYRVNPGIPFSTINGPVPTSSTSSAGTFEFNFTDGARGAFLWRIDQPVPAGFVSGTLAIERFALAGGALNVCTTSTPAPNNAKAASRFLGQATFGPRMADIESLTKTTYESWLEQEFAKQQTMHRPNVNAYLLTFPPEQRSGPNGQVAFNWSVWKSFTTADDQLRQRIAFALSEIFVISNTNGAIASYPSGPANYLDVLGSHAFGNFRNLLESVTYSPMMGIYLSHMRNKKEDAAAGSVPDENFAREVMQLFSIGLHELNQDGTLKRDAQGKPIETYTNADVAGMAKVMTGLSWGGPNTSDASFNSRIDGPRDPLSDVIPMQAYDQWHSTSEKKFLGVTIPASTTANTNADIKIALDQLFNHPNAGPFFAKQMIQRLVSSNPTPAYVSRVAAAFNNNGGGVRGDMKAVLKAILLDSEARTLGANPNGGKLREPVVRMVHWMRSFNARSQDERFGMGTLVEELGQSPMYSPSVFNFFRPGFVPPNSQVGAAGLVSPEAQITDEVNLPRYLNVVLANGFFLVHRSPANAVLVNEIRSDYSAELAISNNTEQLIDRLDLLLTAGNLSPGSRTIIRAAVDSVFVDPSAITPGTNPDRQRNRVLLAVLLMMASSDYVFQD